MENSTDEARDLASAAEQEREEWLQYSEKRLNELDHKLDALRKRGEQRAEHVADETMKRLERARAEAREALAEARESSAEAWQRTKHAADEAFERLQATYESAADALRDRD